MTGVTRFLFGFRLAAHVEFPSGQAMREANVLSALSDRERKLIIRDDDSETVIRGRLDAYDRQTRPVLEFFRGAGHQVIEVDADGDPPEKVHQRICQAMESA